MQYSNRHLVEVNCGFQFLNETTAWDSTYFGLFYEKIMTEGFTERQERKGVQIKFDGNLKNKGAGPITSSEIEDQIIFKNNARGMAIAMGKNRISFHIVKDYKGWGEFITNFIEPYTKIYRELGLGNGPRQCSIVYLNQFIKQNDEKLSDYFTIISPIDTKFGIERTTSIQRVIENDINFLIAKLNSQARPDGLNINLECGAICKSVVCMNAQDWMYQANQTHEPINNFFESLITEKLRKEL